MNTLLYYRRHALRLMAMLLVLTGSLTAAAQNTLRVEDISTAAGKEASIPIYLDNSEEVVGLQFDITLPYAKPSKSNPTLDANRANGHTVSLRKISDTKYTVLVMSLKNEPLRGNAGIVMRFPSLVPETAQIGDTKPIKLENIVVTRASGHNVASAATSEATFTVQYVETPDLTVTGLQIAGAGTEIEPGGNMQLNFNVVNQGTRETGDGWTEKVYLQNEQGTRTFVASTNYNSTLDVNAPLARAYEVTVPQAMKMEGTVKAVVEIVDLKNTGEQTADLGNNTAVSSNEKTLLKRLFFSLDRLALAEGKSKSVTLTRSGDCTLAETFTLAEQNTHGVNRLTLPASVTIKAGQSAASFTVKSVDDAVVNDDTQYRTGVAVSGDDYPAATMTVDVEDNDNYAMRLSLDKEEYTEGENVVLTVTIAEALASDLTVTITNTDAARFYPYVRSITIPAGQTSATATTQVVADDYPQADKTVKFSAEATGFDTSSETVTIIDDDWPQLTMVLAPNVIAEDDGYNASTAIITREGNTRENLMLYLTSSDSEVYFDSQKNIIPAGEKTVSIPVNVKDNAMIDGERTHTITATGMDAYTGKTTGSKAVCSAQLTVTDNDTEAVLKMQSSVATLMEGGSQVTVTVSRNSTEGDLVVSLSCDDPQVVLASPTVTIKSGSKSATFKVKATANAEEGDDHYANVMATADGFQTASFVFLISDQTRPDAVLAMPELTTNAPDYIYYTGQTVNGSISVTNQGAGTLPKNVEIEFYLSDSRDLKINSLYSSSKMSLLGTTVTPSAIESGATLNIPFELSMPDNHVGVYYLFGWINRRNKVVESNVKNGYSKTRWLEIRNPFTVASLTTDKQGYSPGETMTISGRMSNSDSGLTLEGGDVEIIIVGANNVLRAKLEQKLDATGSFSATYKIPDHFAGSYGIGVRCKGVHTIETQKLVSVTALKVVGTYEKLTFTEGVATEGEMKVTNMSASESLTNVTFSFEEMPQDWQIEIATIPTLQPEATGSVHYKVTPSAATSGTSYKRIKVYARGNDAHGNRAEGYKTVDYYSKAAVCKLATSADKGIKTTLSKISQRTWTLTVENTGIRESGDITVDCPTEQPWLSSAVRAMPSLAPGAQAELTLNLTGSAAMLVDGTYKSYVKLKPQNGSAVIVNVEATLVSTDEGRLTVDVVDAYTLADEKTDGPHVSGATVRLTNHFTNEVVITGTTDANGLFTVENLKEGTYVVYATADNHYYTEQIVTVNAGEASETQVFLPFRSVKVTYTVEETTVIDEYRTVITMDVVPDVPTAVLTPTLPDNWGCGKNTYSVRLTNQGRMTAYNPYLEFPNIDGYTFTLKSDYPNEVYPGDSYDVAVEFDGPEEQAKSSIGSIVLHYGYKLRGEMYYSSESYAAMVGCKKRPVVLPGGALGTGPNVNLGGGTVVLPAIPSVSTTRESFGSIELPLIGPGPELPDVGGPSVALQFEQKFFLERQAFKGSLKVENLQMNGIEHITLHPTVRRADDESDATDLFAISYEGKGKWAAGSNWSLTPSGVGEATVLYVPSKETAPMEKTEYLFGGTLTYRDVETAQLITVELMETRLTVNPSPDLHLTYFIQRHFIGDDLRTEEVEPWEPAQFALLIQNKGAGEAIDLKIDTSDPGVVSNLDGKPIKFEKLYTTIDGVEKNFNFNHLELGSIPAGKNIMTRWWFYSSMAAHVTSFNVEMTKHSSYGVEFDLITLDGCYELTQAVKGSIKRPNSQTRVASQTPDPSAGIYLVNRLPDDENLPDYLIDQNGDSTDDLEIVSSSMTAASLGNNQYQLTVSASRDGWVYGNMQDPTNYTMNLVKVIRNSDNADVTSNFWQTDRTVNSDLSTTVSNRLHMADNMARSEKYTLYFEPKPAEEPVVKTIELSPNNTAATKAKVTFKAAIDAATFTAEDVVIMAGDKQYSVTVTPVDDVTFTIDWSGNEMVEGETSLTVFTSGIANGEGTFGTQSKTLTWTAGPAAFTVGDANGDGQVTVTDAVAIISHVLGDTPDGFVVEAADVNGDNSVTVTDAVMLIGRILKNDTGQ